MQKSFTYSWIRWPFLARTLLTSCQLLMSVSRSVEVEVEVAKGRKWDEDKREIFAVESPPNPPNGRSSSFRCFCCNCLMQLAVKIFLWSPSILNGPIIELYLWARTRDTNDTSTQGFLNEPIPTSLFVYICSFPKL